MPDAVEEHRVGAQCVALVQDRLAGGVLEGEAMTWAWPGPRGAPVFNFRSEGRDFSHSDRVLILADGFSCRTQLADLAPRTGIHLAQLLDAPTLRG